MNWQDCTKWVLRFIYASFMAWGWIRPKATNIDLMLFGCTSAFMLLMYYACGFLWEIGRNDGEKYFNNKNRKNETK